MTSGKIFVFSEINKDNFTEIFQEYDVVTDRIDELDLDLRETVENYRNLSNYDVTFTFQSDFKYSREIRGRVFYFPTYYRSEVWIFFAHDNNYLFVFDRDRPAQFISGRIESILRENGYNNQVERLNISNDALLRIVSEDFVRINSSWWKRIGEDLRAAFLSGRLRDSEGENELYRLIEERAGEITVASYLSERLGFNITISRKKGINIYWQKRRGTKYYS
ncbi:hypothetical protein DRP05_11645 [Archaeoglobales archaeon]|nr:MAG: hypothetical protein DRP05_11645 [Archaeoglobales archaeon]